MTDGSTYGGEKFNGVGVESLLQGRTRLKKNPTGQGQWGVVQSRHGADGARTRDLRSDSAAL
ncbi:MAG: hypothetical protein ABI613_02055, partial [Gemmatimonadota bacterium]